MDNTPSEHDIAKIAAGLLPCPFCGSAFKIGQEPHGNGSVGGMWYLYHDYGPVGSAARECLLQVVRHFDTEAEAVAAWNARRDYSLAPDREGRAAVTQADIDAWDQFGPAIFHLDMTGPEALAAHRLAHSEGLPQDVIDLVIAARIVAFEDQSPEALHDLDKAVEPFGERVRWDNQPDDEDQEPTP